MAKKKKTMSLDEALSLLKSNPLALSESVRREAIAIVQAEDPSNPVLKDVEDLLKSDEKAPEAAEIRAAEAEATVYHENLQAADSIASSYDYNAFINDPDNAKDIKPLVDATEIEDEKGNVLDANQKEEHFKRLYYTARDKAIISLTTSNISDVAQSNRSEAEKAVRDEIKTIFFGDFAAIIAAGQMEKPKGEERTLGSAAYYDFINRQSQKATEVFQQLLSKGGKTIKAKSDHFLASTVDSIDVMEEHLNSIRKKLHSKAVQASEKAKAAYTGAATYLQKTVTHSASKARSLWGNRYEIMKGVKNNFKDNKYKLIVNAGVSFATLGLMSAAGPAIAAYATYHAAGSWIWPVVTEMRKINRERKQDGKTKLPFKKQFMLAWRHKTGNHKKTWRERIKDPAARTYFISGAVNTIGAVAGASLLTHVIKAHNATQAVADTVNGVTRGTRRAIAFGRSGMAALAGGTDAATNKALASNLVKKLEQVEDPKQKAELQAQIDALNKMAGTGLKNAGIGFAAALAGQGLMGYFAHNNVEVSPEEIRTALDAGNSPLSADGIGNLHGADSSAFYADSLRMHDADTAFHPDSLHTEGGNSVADSLHSANSLNAEHSLTDTAVAIDEHQPAGLFPTEYSKDMGITEKQYNILTQTTEGTLSSDNPEITLNRAYANAELLAEQSGKTKEQVLWNMNRLYAFMRKAVPMGDGTFREAPHGAEYLTERFGKMNLGLDEDKMSELVDFAQQHTYDSKSEMLAALKETYGDQFKGAQLNKMVSIITSGQRFHQHGEEMEALLKALACGEEMSDEMLAKVGAMLNSTDEILKTGGRNVVLTGLNLEDCRQDQGQWNEVARTIHEQAAEVNDTPAPINEPPVVEPTPVGTNETELESRVRGVEAVTTDRWGGVTGAEEPLYQKHLFDTMTEGNANLDQVSLEENEVIRNISETAGQSRMVEEVSASNFSQITGQEEPDAVRNVYEARVERTSVQSEPVTYTADDDKVTIERTAHSVRATAHVRSTERASVSSLDELTGRKPAGWSSRER